MEKDQSNQLEKVCENLDELTLKQVDLLDEQLVLMTKIGSLLTSGYIDLAKSRYISGDKTVSAAQIPGEDSVVEAVMTVDRDYKNRLAVSRNEEGTNPMKWFGVLVPGSLRQSQQAFQKVLETAVDVVNIRREWLKSIEEYKVQSTLESL